MKTPKKALSTVRSPINDVCKNTYKRIWGKKLKFTDGARGGFFSLLVLEMSIGEEQNYLWSSHRTLIFQVDLIMKFSSSPLTHTHTHTHLLERVITIAQSLIIISMKKKKTKKQAWWNEGENVDSMTRSYLLIYLSAFKVSEWWWGVVHKLRVCSKELR